MTRSRAKVTVYEGGLRTLEIERDNIPWVFLLPLILVRCMITIPMNLGKANVGYALMSYQQNVNHLLSMISLTIILKMDHELVSSFIRYIFSVIIFE